MATTARENAKAINTGFYRYQTCSTCGVTFAMPERLVEMRMVDGLDWWCPLGHRWHYTTGLSAVEAERERAEKLRNELDMTNRLLAGRDEDIKQERRSHAATKGQLTKARKRAAAGVCQWCNRSFEDLARHVASKHPEECADHG